MLYFEEVNGSLGSRYVRKRTAFEAKNSGPAALGSALVGTICIREFYAVPAKYRVRPDALQSGDIGLQLVRRPASMISDTLIRTASQFLEVRNVFTFPAVSHGDGNVAQQARMLCPGDR